MTQLVLWLIRVIERLSHRLLDLIKFDTRIANLALRCIGGPGRILNNHIPSPRRLLIVEVKVYQQLLVLVKSRRVLLAPRPNDRTNILYKRSVELDEVDRALMQTRARATTTRRCTTSALLTFPLLLLLQDLDLIGVAVRAVLLILLFQAFYLYFVQVRVDFALDLFL